MSRGYRAIWARPDQRPHFVQLEPDQARTRCLRLLAEGHPFVVEIDPKAIKDMVIVSMGAKWEEEREKNDYIAQRSVNGFDEAAQYVVNLIAAELCFAVEPQQMPDTIRKEWRITVQIPKEVADRRRAI